MKRITVIYTGMGSLPNDVEKLFKQELGGDLKMHHILDSGLIGDVVAADGLTPQLEKRLTALYDAAATTDADLIIGACSSIGGFTERYAAEHPELKVLRIDYPMARYAAENGKKVVVMATLATTVAPSTELVQRLAAELGREVETVGVTVPGAFQDLISGRLAEATEKVVASAKETCMDADIIILAQASMALFKDAIRSVITPETQLLESPSTCAAYLKNLL